MTESTSPEPEEQHEPQAPEPEPAEPSAPPVNETEDAEAQMRRMSRRSFLWAGIAVASSVGGLKWLNSRRMDDGIVWPLRRALETNGEISRDLFSRARLAPQFSLSRATMPRANGDYGLDDSSGEFDVSAWRLHVEGLASGEALDLTLAEIKKLPKVELVTELKCIEGWSNVVHWGGVRLADFIKKYPPATISGNPPNVENNPSDLLSYVGMTTPDDGYYVSIDMESALHPQTLLCYEMGGKPLTLEHGAPLRLVTPVKYGIKHIKRIGTLTYSQERPKDFWAEQGYDWYSGH